MVPRRWLIVLAVLAYALVLAAVGRTVLRLQDVTDRQCNDARMNRALIEEVMEPVLRDLPVPEDADAALSLAINRRNGQYGLARFRLSTVPDVEC